MQRLVNGLQSEEEGSDGLSVRGEGVLLLQTDEEGVEGGGFSQITEAIEATEKDRKDCQPIKEIMIDLPICVIHFLVFLLLVPIAIAIAITAVVVIVEVWLHSLHLSRQSLHNGLAPTRGLATGIAVSSRRRRGAGVGRRERRRWG
jgi:hypothetical protein